MKLYDARPTLDKLKRRLKRDGFKDTPLYLMLLVEKRVQAFGAPTYHGTYAVAIKQPKAGQPGYRDYLNYRTRRSGAILSDEGYCCNEIILGDYHANKLPDESSAYTFFEGCSDEDCYKKTFSVTS